MNDSPMQPAIVVGVDGSKAATRAALWAVDEAVDRDVPLRLLYALDQGETTIDSGDTARRLANADIAVRCTSSAVEATNKPVKIEVEISDGPPTSSLIRASRSAAMVCVGAVGRNHFHPDRVGSTAAAVAVWAHCPVVVIRGGSGPSRAGCIVAEADTSPGDGVVLGAAVREARLRNAPLRVITYSQAPPAYLPGVTTEADRRIVGRLSRRLDRWRRGYPELLIEPTVVHGDLVDYLAKNAGDVQLLVVGGRDPHHVSELLGPAGYAALGGSDCVVLIVDHQRL
ncbi:universal stress protein [Mycobacterium haemophilum]|uniref:universal stress protein n=1 Tax=Mycobacterium haemophilum TaxID=29311 RepID=UPI0006556BA5|nr:universal stress protein [Mycobacterium haemophilum]MCV7340733.1 universal stress protein [Mycobacterium haemophilum DSM 44634]